MDKSLKERVLDALKSEAAEVEKAKLDFTEELLAIMERQEISRTDLAKLLNVKPSRITSLLRGLNNFTLETLVRLCRAVGGHYRHHIQPEGVVTIWTDWPAIGNHPRFVIAKPFLRGDRIEMFHKEEKMSFVDDSPSANADLDLAA